MKLVRDARGARLVRKDIIISDLPARPRATGSLLDVLAAAGFALREPRRMALLGFACGGLVAPLRAMGYTGAVQAVDLSTEWEGVYRELTADWGGRVDLTRAEASDWLRARRGRFDVIVDDLSEDLPDGGVKKPWVSVGVLPGLIRRRLAPDGIAVINLLPWPGTPWRSLLGPVTQPFRERLFVTFHDFENRILIGGSRLPSAQEASRSIRGALRAIGSAQADRISVRSCWR